MLPPSCHVILIKRCPLLLLTSEHIAIEGRDRNECPFLSYKIHVPLKETRWERTSPVFPELAAGRKEKKFSNPPSCLATVPVFPRPHTSSKAIVRWRIASLQFHVGSLSEIQGLWSRITRLQKKYDTLSLHSSSPKQTQASSSGFIHCSHPPSLLSLGRVASLPSAQFPNWSGSFLNPPPL